MTEEWRAVVGYEGLYEVSDQGRVRSLDRITTHGRKREGRLKAQNNERDGYQTVQLWSSGSGVKYRVHRLVLSAFVGEPVPGYDLGLHGNGNPTDNNLSNLRWGSHPENEEDKKVHGRNWKSNKTHCPAGHAYSEVNTYRHPSTQHRVCKTCARHTKLRTREKGLAPNDPRHGTWNGYATYGCRGSCCVAAMRKYNRSEKENN